MGATVIPFDKVRKQRHQEAKAGYAMLIEQLYVAHQSHKGRFRKTLAAAIRWYESESVKPYHAQANDDVYVQWQTKVNACFRQSILKDELQLISLYFRTHQKLSRRAHLLDWFSYHIAASRREKLEKSRDFLHTSLATLYAEMYQALQSLHTRLANIPIQQSIMQLTQWWQEDKVRELGKQANRRCYQMWYRTLKLMVLSDMDIPYLTWSERVWLMYTKWYFAVKGIKLFNEK